MSGKINAKLLDLKHFDGQLKNLRHLDSAGGLINPKKPNENWDKDKELFLFVKWNFLINTSYFDACAFFIKTLFYQLIDLR